MHFHTMKTRQYTHDNIIIKQVVCPCSFSAFMPSDKLHSVHASLQNDNINQDHMHKTAHTRMYNKTSSSAFMCREHRVHDVNKKNRTSPEVLSPAHTHTHAVQDQTLTHSVLYNRNLRPFSSC